MQNSLRYCFRAALAFLMPAILCSGSDGDQTSFHEEGLRAHPPAVWALTGARVVVSPGQTIPEATVIIRDNRIQAVGPDVSIPADATEVDVSGRTIYAGFIDAYSRQSVSSSSLAKTARYWNNSVTPQLSVADAVEAPESTSKALRQQGLVARLVAPADGVIRGSSVLLATGSLSLNRQLLARDVAQHLELTVARRTRSGYPGSPMGAVALARQAMYDAQWYREAWKAVEADPQLPLPETNDALAALRPVLDGTMPIIVETSNEAFLLRADRFAAEFGLRLIIRGSGREYRRLDDVRATNRPVILPLAFPDAPDVSTPEAAEDITLEAMMHWDLAPENPARLAEAGIPIAFTTDRLSSISDFLKQLRIAVDRGLNPDAALRALTVTPAELFGVSRLLGTVEPGRLASLVITDGDIFQKDTKVLETWVSGERFQHRPEPLRSVDQPLHLKLAANGNLPQDLYVHIDRKDSKLSGHVSRTAVTANSDADTSRSAESEKDRLKLIGVQLSDTSLTASVNTKDWSIDGITRISVVITEPEDPELRNPAGFGSVVWPDGRISACQVLRVTSPDTSESSPGSSSNEPTSVSKSDDGSAQEDSSAETAAAASDDQSANAARGPASFQVNYPLGAYGRESIPETAGRTALVHAVLWTCGPDGVIQDGTLLIEDGQIIGVGHGLEIPDGTTIIDVQGMHISPGMIDCHSHAATDGGVNESTQAITCEVRVGDFIDSDDITIYRQLAGGVTAANILHGSANPIGGQNQVIKLRWGMNGEQLKFHEAPPGVKFALGENVKQSNWGAEATGRYPQTRLGVEQIYRDAFQAARDYARRMDQWNTERRGLPPRRDLELDALREIIEGRRWIHCHSYRQDEILALIRILDEYKVTIGTFQHILEGYKVADEMARHGAMASAFSDWWAYKMEVQDAIPYAGALMHNAGVVVSFNSDDGELARHLNQEAAKAVKYGGVSREEALKFVTLNPAKQLRIDQYVGSLESGKHADFVVWNGDPLSNFSRCEQTWIDGRRWFSRDDDEQLQQSVMEKRNTLIQKILKSGQKMKKSSDSDPDPSSLWPRYDEFCHHLHQSQQVRVLEEQNRQSK